MDSLFIKKIVHSVELMCKSVCIKLCKPSEKFCAKNPLIKNSCITYYYPQPFSTIINNLFTNNYPLFVLNSFHNSTDPTITTTNIFIISNKERI